MASKPAAGLPRDLGGIKNQAAHYTPACKAVGNCQLNFYLLRRPVS